MARGLVDEPSARICGPRRIVERSLILEYRQCLPETHSPGRKSHERYIARSEYGDIYAMRQQQQTIDPGQCNRHTPGTPRRKFACIFGRIAVMASDTTRQTPGRDTIGDHHSRAYSRARQSRRHKIPYKARGRGQSPAHHHIAHDSRRLIIIHRVTTAAASASHGHGLDETSPAIATERGVS